MNKSFPSYIDILQKIINCNFLDFSVLRNKVFFITGATGLLGTVIVDILQLLNEKMKLDIQLFLLTRNAEKAALRLQLKDFEKVHFIEQDIRNDFPENIHADYIFCAASVTHPVAYSQDPFGTIEINLEGTKNCIKLARNCPGCRIIFFSSCEVYGDNKYGVESFKENDCGYIDCNNMRACYNESKRLCECLMQTAHQKYGVDFVTVRLSRVFGPTMLMDDSKASSQFIKNALNKQDIVLKSAGQQRYSYTFVSDAVSGIFTALIKGESGNAYNISGEPIHLCEFAQYCADLAGTKVVFSSASKTESAGFSLANDSVLSTEKLRKLGWKPQYTIREGLQKTIQILSDVK